MYIYIYVCIPTLVKSPLITMISPEVPNIHKILGTGNSGSASNGAKAVRFKCCSSPLLTKNRPSQALGMVR